MKLPNWIRLEIAAFQEDADAQAAWSWLVLVIALVLAIIAGAELWQAFSS